MAKQQKSAILKEISFRPLTIFDITAIVAIEVSVSDNPWGSGLLIGEINKKGFIGLCAIAGEETIVGYVMGQKMVDEFEIRKIAVASQYQTRGIGYTLTKEILKKAKVEKPITIFLEVGSNNVPARNLYKKAGFKKQSVREKYYNNKEDALIMSKTIKGIKRK